MSWLSSIIIPIFVSELLMRWSLHAPAFLSLLSLTWRLRLNLRTFSFSALLSMAGTTENILWKKTEPTPGKFTWSKDAILNLAKNSFRSKTKVDWVKYLTSINKYLTCHHIVPLAARIRTVSLQFSAPLSGSNRPVNWKTQPDRAIFGGDGWKPGSWVFFAVGAVCYN